jgi:hypothetical protein
VTLLLNKRIASSLTPANGSIKLGAEELDELDEELDDELEELDELEDDEEL